MTCSRGNRSSNFTSTHWPHPGHGCRGNEPLRPKAAQWYLLRRGACVQIRSCPRRSPEGPLFRGHHRLAVDYGSAGGGFPSHLLSDLAPQGLLKPLPSAIGPPFSEIPPTPAPRRQVMGRHPPWYAASQYVQYAVYHLLQVHGAPASPGRCRGQQGLQMLPLGIRQIAGICFPIHTPTLELIPQLPPSYFLTTSQYFSHALSVGITVLAQDQGSGFLLRLESRGTIERPCRQWLLVAARLWALKKRCLRQPATRGPCPTPL